MSVTGPAGDEDEDYRSAGATASNGSATQPGWSAGNYPGAGGTGDIGLNGDAGDATAAPLVVIEVDDLEAALGQVEAAGGAITRPIFAYPGGRRFHFREPSGNELAVYVNEAG